MLTVGKYCFSHLSRKWTACSQRRSLVKKWMWTGLLGIAIRFHQHGSLQSLRHAKRTPGSDSLVHHPFAFLRQFLILGCRWLSRSREKPCLAAWLGRMLRSTLSDYGFGTSHFLRISPWNEICPPTSLRKRNSQFHWWGYSFLLVEWGNLIITLSMRITWFKREFSFNLLYLIPWLRQAWEPFLLHPLVFCSQIPVFELDSEYHESFLWV